MVYFDPNIFDNSDKTNPNVMADIENSKILTNIVNKIYDISNIPQTITNQNRLIEIDTYYILKYKAQSDILKKIIFFCCLGLIGAVLYNKKIISSYNYTIYLGFLFALLIIFIAKDIYNIFLRDNTHFKEYDYLAPPVYNSKIFKNTNTIELSNLPTCGL